ncbi:MAG TPA: hypothetical protein VG328_04760 [Stellaceae bacterium]|jgi:hypothetical protein|nr:hypothetical protein [Stellaceae bacterium]
MKRILAIAVLSLSLAGCVYAGPGPGAGYGYYGGYGAGWRVPTGEATASPG